MEGEVEIFIKALTSESRAVLIGGMAVIAHGLSRGTKDVDIWLEPMMDTADWLMVVENAIQLHPTTLSIQCLPRWENLTGLQLIENVALTGMIRIEGLTIPLDIFRKPTGYRQRDFDSIWNKASDHYAGIRLPLAVDLLPTKENTGRSQDVADWAYLIQKSQEEQSKALINAVSEREASSILDHYFDYEICERGLQNPNQDVRNVILEELNTLAKNGDPFATEILQNHAS